MPYRRVRALLSGGVVVAVMGLAGCSGHTGSVTTSAAKISAEQTSAPASASAGRVEPTVRPAPDPHTIATVGALFPAGVTSAHTCTAAVVTSPAGNVILTAAHCVSGSGAGLLFVPGYDNGRAPYGSWTVTRAYSAGGWKSGQNPKLDYAFLVVRPVGTNRTPGSVQSVVGANALAARPPAVGAQVTVAGYRFGRDDPPLICNTTVYTTQGYPSFHCPGYVAGTSGAPWIAGLDASRRAGTIMAVIGGLHQGGCSPDTSYSAPFTSAVSQVLARAVAAGRGDDFPVPGPDGC